MVKQALNRKSIKQQETIHAATLKHLDAVTSNADIDIAIHDAPVVDIILETYEGGPELKLHHVGGIAEIIASKPLESAIFQRRLGLPPCKLRITIPQDVTECWHILSRSGDIHVKKLVTDLLHVKSASGDIDITEIKANEAYFQATSGNITARNNKLNELQLETSSGDAKVETIQGDIKGSASSGDVVVTNQQGEKIELETSSGDIHVENSVVKQVMCNASAGDIEIEQLMAEHASMGTSSGDMIIRGFAGVMKGRTNSGSIHLSFISKFTLDLSAGSGDIVITGEQDWSTKVEVKTGSGKISSNYQTQINHHTKNEFSSTIGEGENDIVVKTGSGNVILQ